MGQGASCISKGTAEKVALAAVKGGTVVAVVFEGGDNPRHWSVDITHKDGTDYEVWVSCTGKILSIIKGN
ncbi:MAG: PepSY domain-containing protein [Terriglobia bacterium]